MSRLDNYRSDDDITKKQLEEFDTLVDDGVISISDSDSEPEQTSNTREPKAPASTLPYPDGTVRLTRIVDSPAIDTMTLSDLVQKHTVKKALVTTFVLDIDWLLAHFNKQTKIVIVAHYNPKVETPGVYQMDGGRVTIIRPDYSGLQRPIMHSKLMLLFYPGYVRFVASSANLFSVDWTVLQNILFIQDFPLLEQETQGVVKSRFGSELKGALRDLSVPEQVVGLMDQVDFRKAKAHIITSVPSKLDNNRKHSGKYGVARLHEVCKKIKDKLDPLETTSWFNSTLYCYGSSMGKLTFTYLRDFYLCALGTTHMEYRRHKGLDTLPSVLAQNVNVGFHTQDQGNQNRFGSVPRECIKFHSAYYFDENYASSRLHKITPSVDKTLVHAKAVLARYGESGSKGWMYLGSHNFTPGAWGYASLLDQSVRIRFLNNFEFGIVLTDVCFESMFGRDSVLWNGAKVPLPFKLKWEPYGQMDLPCMNME
ncbi:hypothetical protein J3B02_000522 [Coemansia erecta]|nr:hypothetical protein J3B02_000522 [Coemansia erecta]KAJ2876082.1 hypothetical protein FB639_003935 [Coemansia asiatica]